MQCLELGRLITYPVEARRAVGMAMMGGMCAGDSKFRAALGKGSARGDGGDGGDGGHAVAVEVRGAGCPRHSRMAMDFILPLFGSSSVSPVQKIRQIAQTAHTHALKLNSA